MAMKKPPPWNKLPAVAPLFRDGRRYPIETRAFYFNWNRTVTVNTAGFATPLMSSGL
jgi:hypothetical protein